MTAPIRDPDDPDDSYLKGGDRFAWILAAGLALVGFVILVSWLLATHTPS